MLFGQVQVLAGGAKYLHLLGVNLFSSSFWFYKIALPWSVVTSPLELFGMALTLVCVTLTVRQNILCWPIGIVAAIAYGFLFFHFSLLADTYLQGFYVGTSIYGWYWWLRGGPNFSRLPVSSLDARQRIAWAIATLLAVASVGYFHANYTKAALPYLDALASGTSVSAQLLMMRKKRECWPLWVFVNVLSIYIYISTQVILTAVLYAMLLLLAILGWRQWTQESHSQTPLPTPASSNAA